MSRPLRIEYPGALYHVTSRGDRREPIYRDDADRITQLDILGQTMERFDAQALAYCLMGNHYHLVLHTRAANLSRFMRHLNGVYTQAFNRRHGLVGHLFQGRFKAILVDRDSYLLALVRYVERNPVGAGLVASPADWAWSSCRAHLGLSAAPPWLDRDALLGQLLGRDLRDARDHRRAASLYADLLQQARPGDAAFWAAGLRQQVYLGDDDFVTRAQSMAEPQRLRQAQIPKASRHRPGGWQDWLARCEGDRDAALLAGYREGGLTMTALAQMAELSVTHVSRLIAREEGKGKT
jgi:putative transposase